MPSLEANQLLRVAVDACDSKKAEDIRILALDPSESALTDYFLICSGTNERQNVAISDEIEYRLKQEFRTYPNSVEGRRQGEWVLMDYVDFVVHIFMPEKREHYALERLRKTATSLSIEDLDALIAKAQPKPRTRPAAKKLVAAKAPVPVRTRTSQLKTASAAVIAKTPAAKKTAAKKVVAKKTAATKVVAKKTAPKKVVAKKTAVKKTVAKKAPAKKAPAKKVVAKKSAVVAPKKSATKK